MSPAGRVWKWIPLLPVALLLLVALAQLYLVRTHALAPWKGGGFGMFSATDVAARRSVRIYLTRDGHTDEIPVPPELQESAARVRALPSEGRLRDLARRIALVQAQAVDIVRIEVWRVRFDSRDLAPHPVRLAYAELPRFDAR